MKPFSTGRDGRNERNERSAADLSRKLTGRLGEDLAAKHLLNEGYAILERNFRNRFGEIDIIALKDSTVHFFEVKTRKGPAFGTPEEAVDRRKLGKILGVARFFLAARPRFADSPVSFAVIGVVISGGRAEIRVTRFGRD